MFIFSKIPTKIPAIIKVSFFGVLTCPIDLRLSDPVVGMSPMVLSSDKSVVFIQNEIRIWTPVIKAGNIRVD